MILQVTVAQREGRRALKLQRSLAEGTAERIMGLSN